MRRVRSATPPLLCGWHRARVASPASRCAPRRRARSGERARLRALPTARPSAPRRARHRRACVAALSCPARSMASGRLRDTPRAARANRALAATTTSRRARRRVRRPPRRHVARNSASPWTAIATLSSAAFGNLRNLSSGRSAGGGVSSSSRATSSDRSSALVSRPRATARRTSATSSSRPGSTSRSPVSPPPRRSPR